MLELYDLKIGQARQLRSPLRSSFRRALRSRPMRPGPGCGLLSAAVWTHQCTTSTPRHLTDCCTGRRSTKQTESKNIILRILLVGSQLPTEGLSGCTNPGQGPLQKEFLDCEQLLVRRLGQGYGAGVRPSRSQLSKLTGPAKRVRPAPLGTNRPLLRCVPKFVKLWSGSACERRSEA